MDKHILDDSARKKLHAPEAERISFVQADVFVPYKFVKDTLATLEGLYDHERISRMPCVLITGRRGSGKSTILERFSAKHPIDPNPNGAYAKAPVVRIQARQNASETRFYRDFKRLLNPRDVINRINPELAVRRQTDRLNDTGWTLLERVGLKMPLIDEIHNLVVHVPKFEKPYPNMKFLGDLRYLHNEYRLSIVGAGVEAAKKVIEADDQLDSRFNYIDIPDWSFNQDFADFLAGLESYLPFPEPSNLGKKPLSETIHRLLTKGERGPTTDDIRGLIRKSAAIAIRRGGRKVTQDDIIQGMSAII